MKRQTLPSDASAARAPHISCLVGASHLNPGDCVEHDASLVSYRRTANSNVAAPVLSSMLFTSTAAHMRTSVVLRTTMTMSPAAASYSSSRTKSRLLRSSTVCTTRSLVTLSSVTPFSTLETKPTSVPPVEANRLYGPVHRPYHSRSGSLIDCVAADRKSAVWLYSIEHEYDVCALHGMISLSDGRPSLAGGTPARMPRGIVLPAVQLNPGALVWQLGRAVPGLPK
mmetsp:Transcript_25255/g.88099  ORF Transcript_25255/g.88099 Transcript_25255/m.88099 type:complete len:226 (-) Transcript_25255:486-1163(-)